MARILVTGGSGFIGRRVTKRLLDQGHDVTVATHSPDEVDSRASLARGSIFDTECSDLFERMGSPEVCIHLAWTNGFRHDATDHMFNLSSHLRFCHRMMESGLRILNCMGSMHEVGYWEGPVCDNVPCRPLNQYGIAKNAMRESVLLDSKNYHCKVNWLRGFYLVSDDPSGANIFSKIVQAEQRGDIEFPMNSGKNMYDFIDLDEFVRLLCKASMQTEITGVINVCSGTPVSLASRVESFVRDHEFRIKLKYGAFPERPYDSPGIWGDATKIHEIDRRFPDKIHEVMI